MVFWCLLAGKFRTSNYSACQVEMPVVNGGNAVLPVEDTRRDLAVLRAANVDLSALLPPLSDNSQSGDNVLHKSYEYVASLRCALKIAEDGDIEHVVNGILRVLHVACADPRC